MDWPEIVRYSSTKEIIKSVISEGILNDGKELDYLVLNAALEYGKKEIADFLLNHNCKVNSASRRSDNPHNTPLHNAVLLEDVRLVNILIEKEAQIHARNADNSTPLHLAFLKKNNQIVNVLLAAMESSSSYENVKNKFGLTALHIASTTDNTTVIRNLLKAKADLEDSISNDSVMWKGFTALHFAAEYKSLEAMKILVAGSSRSIRRQKNGNGQTAMQMINNQMTDLMLMSDLLSLNNDSNSYKNLSNFHVACTRDNSDTIKNFLDKGALINAPVNPGLNIYSNYTPLHFATESKRLENVQILQMRGADLNSKNLDDQTPLHLGLYTEENGYRTPLVNFLYSHTEKKEDNPKDDRNLSYFHIACSRNDVELVKKLLDKNVDINSRVTYQNERFYNYTPLHFATVYDNPEVAQILIDAGADVNSCNDSHTGTPILQAFFNGNKLLIDMLLNSGADPKAIRPNDKETTLNCLIYGYIDKKNKDLLPYIEKLIMEYGVDVNAKDHDGDTALHIACENLFIAAPCVKLLLEFGADINATNDKGETPFMWAMEKKLNQHRDNADDYVMLYHHVQKLKTLGLEVDEKNERCCEQLLKKRAAWVLEDLSDDGRAFVEQERMEEIERMKKVELVEDLSVYDFIMREPATYLDYDVAGLNFNTTSAIAKQFPIYGYLIRLQLQKIEIARRAIVQVNYPVKRRRSESNDDF